MSKKENIRLIKERIADEPGFAVACMLEILKAQTAEEQSVGVTHEENGVGFSSFDAPFLTEMCDVFETRGRLSDKQMACVQKGMKKYARQLLDGNPPKAVDVIVESKDQKAERRKKEKEEYMKKVSEASKPSVSLIDKSTMKIVFPYDLNTIAIVKTLSGRRFVNDGPYDKYWTAPLSSESVETLMNKTEIPISEEIKSWYIRLQGRKNRKIDLIDVEGVIDGILRPFQHEGVSFIESRDGRALLGDEMGLGKTIQAITWMALHRDKLPAVVICPASLKENWKREVNQWCPKQDVVVINGECDGELPLFKNTIYIINYDIIADKRKKIGKKTVRIENTGWMSSLIKLNPRIVVLDESHYIKNQKAYRTIDVSALAKKAEHLICMSGTPIINRPIEMYNTISLIDPTMFPSFFQYAQRYCGATHNGYGWDFKGATNTEELHNKLTESIMVRRLKKDVMKDLPPKVRTVIPLKLDNMKGYQLAESTACDGLGDKNGADALVEMEMLKQMCVEGKMKQAIEWIRNFIDQEKLVVFCHHKKVVDQLMKEFKDVAVKVDGGTQHRQEAVDAFQNDPSVKLFVGTLAAIEGLTLTAASSTCFLELWWSPGSHDQGEDRVHRIGQEADSVNAYYLVGVDTVEEDIAELLDQKRSVLASVLDGVDVEESSLLLELLKRFENR